MIRNGRKNETRSGRAPPRGASLNFERNAPAIGLVRREPSLRACRRRVTLGQVRRDDLVDLLLRIRLQARFENLVRASPPDDDPQPSGSGVPRTRDELLELLRGRARERLLIQRDQAVALGEADSLRGTPRRDRLDHQPARPFLDRDAEKPAAAQHLPDQLVALARRCAALGLFRKNGGRHDARDKSNSGDALEHWTRRVSWPPRTISLKSRNAVYKSEKVQRIPCVSSSAGASAALRREPGAAEGARLCRDRKPSRNIGRQRRLFRPKRRFAAGK